MCGFYIKFKINRCYNNIFSWSDINMNINKKAIVALSLLLVVAYGLSMATAGVSTPGCTESGP
ncbi:MAG: hypothetical protein BAJALOKI1v1_130043 [Promethearchaeota archaeon]|nr:MAG: hypothetical protein BAJALOKI1v1_130043 [Candidatus Lokiarchaeota archaeon]